MTSGSVGFFLSPIFGQLLIYVFNKGAVPTVLNFFTLYLLIQILTSVSDYLTFLMQLSIYLKGKVLE